MQWNSIIIRVLLRLKRTFTCYDCGSGLVCPAMTLLELFRNEPTPRKSGPLCFCVPRVQLRFRLSGGAQ